MAPTVGLTQKGWYAMPGSVEISWPPLLSVPSMNLKGVAREQSVGLTGPAAPTNPLPPANWRFSIALRAMASAPVGMTPKMYVALVEGAVGTVVSEVLVEDSELVEDSVLVVEESVLVVDESVVVAVESVDVEMVTEVDVDVMEDVVLVTRVPSWQASAESKC